MQGWRDAKILTITPKVLMKLDLGHKYVKINLL